LLIAAVSQGTRREDGANPPQFAKRKRTYAKKIPLVCLAALIFAAAGPLVIAVSAEGKPKPNTAEQGTAKSEPAKPGKVWR
jgi:cell division protein FtsN